MAYRRDLCRRKRVIGTGTRTRAQISASKSNRFILCRANSRDSRAAVMRDIRPHVRLQYGRSVAQRSMASLSCNWMFVQYLDAILESGKAPTNLANTSLSSAANAVTHAVANRRRWQKSRHGKPKLKNLVRLLGCSKCHQRRCTARTISLAGPRGQGLLECEVARRMFAYFRRTTMYGPKRPAVLGPQQTAPFGSSCALCARLSYLL